jgi:hypothetical protein
MKDKSDFDSAINNVENLIFEYGNIYNNQGNNYSNNNNNSNNKSMFPII